MLALDLIRPSITAMRVITSVNDGFARELRLPPHIRSFGFITTDFDDMVHIAADKATKQAMAEAVYDRPLHVDAAHSPSPASGEVLIMLGGPDPTEVHAGLDAIVANIEDGAVSQWANDAEDIASLAYVVSRTGSYLSIAAERRLGDPMVYLVTPPPEAIFGIDAVLKSADIQLMAYIPPPSETNHSVAFLTGSQVARKAACNAFVDVVLSITRNPIQRA